MRRIRILISLSLVLIVAPLAPAPGAEDVKAIPGVGPVGPMSVVHEGFKFLEGPAADATGALYFTDVFNRQVYKANPGGQAESVLAARVAGLMFGPDGRVYMTAGGISALDLNTKEVTPLVNTYNGKPFNGPNDLVVDRAGGIYFTDPKVLSGSQDASAVYYLPAGATEAIRVAKNLLFPNGLILTPDEQTLLVAQYSSPEVLAFAVAAPGKLGESRVHCQIEPNAETKKRAGGDGVTIDSAGNLYVAAPGTRSIQVFGSDGKFLGQLPVDGKVPTNCTFAGADLKMLYITTTTALLAYPMQIQGHRCGTGK
ncbi:MAG: SMP-30/gluconolactonase/LRE family protein [Pirellulales bacterium]|nr:SMP-30/gluconolactonase/LRE family protein [Pirellulales bacterium]